MTSNLKDETAVKKHFAPEFINRIDEFVFFNALTIKEMPAIVKIQLSRLSKRLIDEHRINLDVSDKAVEWLASNGFDANYGARPLRRFIMSNVEDKIADLILSGKLSDGGIVKVDVKGKELVIES